MMEDEIMEDERRKTSDASAGHHLCDYVYGY